MRTLFTFGAAPAAILVALAGTAAAQGIVRPQEPQRAPVAGAPALPGLAARRAPAPIAADPAANLAPNAALFDAVNRGDIAAAREAVSRGANVNARNALGLTALDAAVDQGRNDIAFYLLSARDAARGPMPDEESEGARRAAATPPPVQRAAPRPPRAPLNAPPAVAEARGAQLWANDGGAPRPDVGFLGFDAGRPADAVPPAPQPARRNTRG